MVGTLATYCIPYNRNFYYLFFLLGVRTQSAITEDLWQQSMQMSNGEQTSANTSNGRISPFVNFLLLGLFVAIPYLIHKLSSTLRLSEIRGNYC